MRPPCLSLEFTDALTEDSVKTAWWSLTAGFKWRLLSYQLAHEMTRMRLMRTTKLSPASTQMPQAASPWCYLRKAEKSTFKSFFFLTTASCEQAINDWELTNLRKRVSTQKGRAKCRKDSAARADQNFSERRNKCRPEVNLVRSSG